VVEGSSAGAAAILVVIAAYQIALALGAPWGEPAFSDHPETGDKVLSHSYRIISGVAAAVVVLAAWVVAACGGLVARGPFSDRLLTGATWFIAAYLVVDIVANLGSASAAKRWIGGTAKLLAALLCIIVALNGGTT
jgi:hypothetical protein